MEDSDVNIQPVLLTPEEPGCPKTDVTKAFESLTGVETIENKEVDAFKKVVSTEAGRFLVPFKETGLLTGQTKRVCPKDGLW